MIKDEAAFIIHRWNRIAETGLVRLLHPFYIILELLLKILFGQLKEIVLEIARLVEDLRYLNVQSGLLQTESGKLSLSFFLRFDALFNSAGY